MVRRNVALRPVLAVSQPWCGSQWISVEKIRCFKKNLMPKFTTMCEKNAPIGTKGSFYTEVQLLLDKLARSEGENRRLIAENDALLEQFVRWAYNAHTRGLSEAFLNSAPPLVDRKRSKRGQR